MSKKFPIVLFHSFNLAGRIFGDLGPLGRRVIAFDPFFAPAGRDCEF